MAATVEESTPPDMATAMVLEGSIGKWDLALSNWHLAKSKEVQLIANGCLIVNRGEFSQAGYGLGKNVESEVDLFRLILLA